MLELENYIRKPFNVQVVLVTPENIEEVAEWCNGTIQVARGKNRPPSQYVKVNVQGTATPRQKMAFPGDRVLFAGKGFKVYTPNAFSENFDKANEEIVLVPTSKDSKIDQAAMVVTDFVVEDEPYKNRDGDRPKPGPRKGVVKKVTPAPVGT